MAGNSAIFKKANQLMKEGYDRKQAFAVAYSELGEPKKAKRKTVRKNPAVKRKTRATTMSKARSYVGRPSQITKMKPEKRLIKRRTINLRVPVGVFPNPRSGDEVAARELFLFGSNDGDLYRQRTQPIIDNLAKKVAKGTYDFQKSLTLWKYWADDAAKRYAKEYGGAFDVPTRKLAAQMAADYYGEHVQEESVKFHRPAKRNPARKSRSVYTDFIVSESLNGKTGWKIVATFLTEKSAAEYAHALEHKNAIENKSRYIQVTSKLHELRAKSAR